MNKQQLIYWKSEREMLDRLYCDRMREWLRGWRPGASAPTDRPESQELEVRISRRQGLSLGCMSLYRRKK